MRQFANGAVNGLLRRFGYRLARLPANRFQAMGETLQWLQSSGYAPRVIIDAGANVGDWARLACTIFPHAAYHLVEPQPQCRPHLEALKGRLRNSCLHAVALSEPGTRSVHMVGADGSSGAWVSVEPEANSIELPAAALDDIISVGPADHTLLKLDLEGHELVALRGAEHLLRDVEVVITEVSFYRPPAEPGAGANANTQHGPVFLDIAAFLRDRSFELYDFAALAAPLSNRRLRTGDAVFIHKDSPLRVVHNW
jgi:FkbM family methyltransferase